MGELDAEVFDDDLGSTSPLDQAMAFTEQDALQQQQGHVPVVDRDPRAYNHPADDYMDEDLIGDESGINNAYNSLMEKVADIQCNYLNWTAANLDSWHGKTNAINRPWKSWPRPNL